MLGKSLTFSKRLLVLSCLLKPAIHNVACLWMCSNSVPLLWIVEYWWRRSYCYWNSYAVSCHSCVWPVVLVHYLVNNGFKGICSRYKDILFISSLQSRRKNNCEFHYVISTNFQNSVMFPADLGHKSNIIIAVIALLIFCYWMLAVTLHSFSTRLLKSQLFINSAGLFEGHSHSASQGSMKTR